MSSACNYCSKPEARNKCGGCHRAFYCDTTCQRKDWNKSGHPYSHKNICKEFKQALKHWYKPRAKIIPMQYHKALIGILKICYKPINSKKYYILCVSMHQVSLYDPEENSISVIAKMPKSQRDMMRAGFGPGMSAGFVDTKHNKLYLFSTIPSKTAHAIGRLPLNELFVLNLESKEWTVIEASLKLSTSLTEQGIYYPMLHFINDRAHFIYLNEDAGHHEIFDFKTNTFIELNNNAHELRNPISDLGTNYPASCVCIEALNKFVVLLVDKRTIWSLDMNEQNELEAKWRKERTLSWPNGLPLLTTMGNSVVVLGFDCVIFLFAVNLLNLGQSYMEIWCLDVFSGRWYQSEKRVPQYFMEEGMSTTHHAYISTGGRYAHYFDMHFVDKIDLYDVSPVQLRNDWNNLIFGFVREVMYVQRDIFHLKNVILSYYSMFEQ